MKKRFQKKQKEIQPISLTTPKKTDEPSVLQLVDDHSEQHTLFDERDLEVLTFYPGLLYSDAL